jgi:hypothetical protein
MLAEKVQGLFSAAAWGGAVAGEAAWALRTMETKRLTIPKDTILYAMASDVNKYIPGTITRAKHRAKPARFRTLSPSRYYVTAFRNTLILWGQSEASGIFAVHFPESGSRS